MTPADVDILVNNAPVPPGYRLEVEPQRRHKYRSLWSVRVYRDDQKVWGRAYYNPAAGIVAAQAVAWAMSREAAA